MSDRNALDSIPFPVLIGDLGGTNARFALIESSNSALERLSNIQTADYPTIEDAIKDAVLNQTKLRPRSAILALAGPITGERVPLTNCHWVVEPSSTMARFGIGEMILLNDFEALSLSLADFGPEDVDPIGGGKAAADGARIVVGPGTGLGAGALIRTRDSWIPVPGEGGHIDLGPVSSRDFEIWPHLERSHGRISGETLLCGPGLVRLYRGICETDDVPPAFDSPEEVANAGLSDTNPQAVEALTLFATYLGRVVGNLALTFMARGGVYLAGGISTKIAPMLKSGVFRAAFLDKAPHRALLEEMATAIIIKPDAALAGLAAFSRKPIRFDVDLAGRHWRG
jgi:glucokinase